MKTSHIVILVAVVIIGLLFFFAGQSKESTDVTVTDIEEVVVEDTSAKSVPEVDNTTYDSSVETDQALPETEAEEMVVVPEVVPLPVETIKEVTPKVIPVEPEPVANKRSFTIDSFIFGYSMEEIRVKQGDIVTINLTNSDGFHDWVVDEFGAATDTIQAGETTSITFVASKKGTFEYYCSVGSHRAQGMVGNLIVE